MSIADELWRRTIEALQARSVRLIGRAQASPDAMCMACGHMVALHGRTEGCLHWVSAVDGPCECPELFG